MKTAFVTTFCSHYRVRTFETLASQADVHFFFFSEGRDWYWQQENGIRSGAFQHEYLPGFSIGSTRVTPDLPLRLLRKQYDVYLKCINGRWALPITYLIARLRGKPFILWTGIWMRLQTTAHRLLLPLTRYMYLHSDAVVVYGAHVKRFLEDEGVPEERIFIANQAVDNDSAGRTVDPAEVSEIRARLNLDAGKKVILYVGRLEQEKGCGVLIDALTHMNAIDTVLILVGAGSYRKQLAARVRQLRLESRVRFVGHVAPETTPIWYAMAWVCVVPSITTATFKEPWGLAVNEAFNQAIPVVATTAVGACAGGLVKHRVNGLVVAERSCTELAAAIDEIVLNTRLRRELSRNASTTIVEWDTHRMVSGFLDAIEYVTRTGRFRARRAEPGNEDPR